MGVYDFSTVRDGRLFGINTEFANRSQFDPLPCGSKYVDVDMDFHNRCIEGNIMKLVPPPKLQKYKTDKLFK